jgi:hypothetical protein
MAAKTRRQLRGGQQRQLRGSQHCDCGAISNGEYMAADLWLRGSVQQQHLHSH